MPRFLSAAWLDELATALGTAPSEAEAPGASPVTIQQVVTGTPHGDVRYAVRVAGGVTTVLPGGVEAPDVTVTTDWDTAVAVASGATGAQEAFLAGRLRLSGDGAALLTPGGPVSAAGGLAGVLAALGDRTTY